MILPNLNPILAQAARNLTPDELRQLWPQDFRPTFLPPFYILLPATILIISLIVLLVHLRARRRHQESSPLTTFRELAHVLNLPYLDQWLLIRIARQQKLPTPLTLLLSPNTLTHHAHLYALNKPGYLRQHILRRTQTLQQRIFPVSA